MSFSRRRFLTSVPPVIVAGTAIAAPSSGANTTLEPIKSRHELAIWHIRELERLIIEDGAKQAFVSVAGFTYPDGEDRGIFLRPSSFSDEEELFRQGGSNA